MQSSLDSNAVKYNTINNRTEVDTTKACDQMAQLQQMQVVLGDTPFHWVECQMDPPTRTPDPAETKKKTTK